MAKKLAGNIFTHHRWTKMIKIFCLLFLIFSITACKAIDDLAFKNLYPYQRVNRLFPMENYIKPIDLVEVDFDGVKTWGKITGKKIGIIYLCGNGENLRSLYQSGLFKKLEEYGDFLVIQYPKYGHSSGELTEKYIVEKTIEISYFMSSLSKKIVLFGRSLGAAIAIQAASRLEGLHSLILISPWTSLKEIIMDASSFGKYVSDEFYMINGYNSALVASLIDTPTLIIHGNKDETVNVKYGIRMHDKIKGSTLQIVNGASHNTIYQEKKVWETIKGHLNQ